MSEENFHDPIKETSTTEGLPVAPSMSPALHSEHIRSHAMLMDVRGLRVIGLSLVTALGATLLARVLTASIALITNLSYFGRFSLENIAPGEHHLGPFAIFIPVVGGFIVGLMAKYGSRAIRGHGIPEAMEQILTNDSRIPPRLLFLKPFSAAIAIGTGGPFGAEGPIIASGAALGSCIGQWLKTTSTERKIILAAGAAAGMTATFGTPFAAVALAIELLLFEFHPRSYLPVAFACILAAALRVFIVGGNPCFQMTHISPAPLNHLWLFVFEGLVIGALAIAVTWSVYWIEDAFEKLPISWVFWPALGAIVTGVVGYFAPETLGVGYDNIDHLLLGGLTQNGAAHLGTLKYVSWAISLGSGTSGGTLAPLFTIGGSAGAMMGHIFQSLVVDFSLPLATLVGMTALFAGASRAFFASILFALETTHEWNALLALLCGCGAAYLVTCLRMKNSIMTEKLARRGIVVPAGYTHKG